MASSRVSEPQAASRFDRAYYRRYYLDPKTAVTSAHEMRLRAALVAAYCDHVGLPVRRILDAGCGTGLMRRELLRRLKRASYVGLELSEYLCARHGWVRGRIEDYAPAAPFDLVICYDVAQYLDAGSVRRACANLARICRGVLYFTALTRADWNENCDRRRTDKAVHMRSAEWYRRQLRRGFREIGAGFWLRRGAPLTVWELESVRPSQR